MMFLSCFAKKQIQAHGGNREHGRDQAFQQESASDRSPERVGPEPRPGSLLVKRAKKRPHRESDHGSENDVGNQDAREEKQADARRNTEPGVESGPGVEGPTSDAIGQPGQERLRSAR